MNCPKCNDFIETDEYDDFEFEDCETLIARVFGHCPTCKVGYAWDEIFLFKEERNLRETT